MFVKLMAVMLVLALVAPVAAQTAPVWRTFAARIDVGSRIKLRLRDGQRVSATLIEAAPDDLIVQPLTRVRVPIQHVPYDAIVSLERDEARGVGVGKAVGIGVAAGAGAFLGAFLVLLAAFD
jgi:hypothetical protein